MKKKSYIDSPKLTKDGPQMALQCLQDCHLDFLHGFAQELFAGGTEQLVGLMVKIIDVHHLQEKEMKKRRE